MVFLKLLMDIALLNLCLTVRFLVVLSCCLVSACTSKPESRMPEEKVIHFPSSLALSPDGKTLVIGSSAADGKYDFGRLISVATKSIKTALDGADTKEPIDWSKVVATNLLIPQEIGELNYSDRFLTFASFENNLLMALPVTAGALNCNGPEKGAQSCPGASTLAMSEHDPFAIKSMQVGATDESLLVSYLSSDRIDMVKINSGAMMNTKSFNALDWLTVKLPDKSFKNRRVITKKIHISFKNDLARSKAYFLLEEHPKKNQTITRAKASYLVAILVKDLVAQAPIVDSMIELWDFFDQFSIASVQDLFIDDGQSHIYLLARIPESLFKINLNTKELMDVNVVCTGARSMVVSTAKDSLIVPCFAENRVALYTLSPFRLKQSSGFVGRGPSACVVDEAHALVYCTFSKDGTLVIFDDKLSYRGYIFPKAPNNRIGS
jgi:hypothetical protein